MPPAINNASQIANRTGIVTSSGTALSANANRRWFVIQNLDTDPLFVKFGDSASATDFDFVLQGGTGNDDGKGGKYSSDTVVYTGIVSVSGTTPRFTATEI